MFSSMVYTVSILDLKITVNLFVGVERLHIFLTGAPGCGKSTVINRVLAGYSGRVGGFRTGFGPGRESVRRSLYLWPAWDEPRYDEAHTVARFDEGGAVPLPRRFSALGSPTLCGVDTELIIMDECGRLEEGALPFQSAILRALDCETPVLGVVRQGFPGWTRDIATHPGVTLITVTEESRDALPDAILARLRAVIV